MLLYFIIYQNVELNKKYHTGTIDKIPIQTRQRKA